MVLLAVAGFEYAQMSTLQSQVASLQNQVTNLQSQTTTLQSTNSAQQSQISSLQSQVSSLQSTVNTQNSLLSLSTSITEANQVTINQAAGGISTITSFTAGYAGYIEISGTSTTTNGYIQVTDSWYLGGNPTNYSIGTGATIDVAVLPGTITVSFGNNNISNGASATITVIYHS